MLRYAMMNSHNSGNSSEYLESEAGEPSQRLLQIDNVTFMPIMILKMAPHCIKSSETCSTFVVYGGSDSDLMHTIFGVSWNKKSIASGSLRIVFTCIAFSGCGRRLFFATLATKLAPESFLQCGCLYGVVVGIPRDVMICRISSLWYDPWREPPPTAKTSMAHNAFGKGCLISKTHLVPEPFCKDALPLQKSSTTPSLQHSYIWRGSVFLWKTEMDEIGLIDETRGAIRGRFSHMHCLLRIFVLCLRC